MKVAVIGAGISGLSCALALQDGGADPLVFEAASRAGGWVGTDDIEGHLCERGPAALRGPGPESRLLERLELEQAVVPAAPEAKQRYLVKDGDLVPAPMGPLALMRTPLLPPLGRLRLLGEFFVRPKRDDRDETVAEFFKRRFGKHSVGLADPVVAGVFAGDSNRLSLPAAFPALAEWEREHGGVLKGAFAQKGPRKKLYSLKGGLGTLSRRAATALGDRLHCGRPVTKIVRSAKGWEVEGEIFDHLVLALPANTGAPLLKDIDAELCRLLACLPFAPVAVLSLTLPRSAFTTPPQGFGCLVPRGEGLRTLGCIFESSLFPHRAPEGQVLLRVMAGGRHDPAIVDEDPGVLSRELRDEVEALLGARQKGRILRAAIYPDCLPQYELGHLAWLEEVNERVSNLPALHLTGNSYRGVSVPECIADGYRTARRILNDLPGTRD